MVHSYAGGCGGRIWLWALLKPLATIDPCHLRLFFAIGPPLTGFEGLPAVKLEGGGSLPEPSCLCFPLDAAAALCGVGERGLALLKVW